MLGDQKINPHEQTIESVHLLIEDGNKLFHDDHVFGHIIDAKPYIDQVVKFDTEQRPFPKVIDIGPEPEIAYFTGKIEPFSADTVLGKVSAYRALDWTFGNTDGIHVGNKVWIAIEFDSPTKFYEAYSRMSVVQAFFELIAGRPQNLKGILVKHKGDYLHVYSSGVFSYDRNDKDNDVLTTERLIDVGKNPEDLSNTIAGWIQNHEDRKSAREQFFSNYRKGNLYDIDRLVGAANMFDILPIVLFRQKEN